MDWERTKSILIITFILLNGVLGYQWWSSNSNETQLVAIESVTMDELNTLLQSKQIQILEEIPKEVPKLNDIIVKLNETITSTMTKYLENPTTMAVILSKSVRNNNKETMQIPKISEYRYDPVVSGTNFFMFNQMHMDYPLFDVNLKLIQDQDTIRTYTQSYVEVETNENENEQRVIPAYVVIRSLAENYLDQKSIIESIQLGYHGQKYNSQTQFMVPSWRVVLQNGEIYYIHAYNGSIELPETSK
jgi:regulatory protein YycI of two-component signal transduction system YycFG